jgi:hypothetical protein
LKDILIIDNYVYSFAFQLENGIPIVPYFGEKDDTEMIKVARYFAHIHESNDLREANEKAFSLKKILNSRIDCFIKYYNFDDISDLDDPDEDIEGIALNSLRSENGDDRSSSSEESSS